MNYQGPECFKGLIEASYSIIQSVYPRVGTPNIIIGGIGKIYNNDGIIITEGDSETNSLIDLHFDKFFKVSQEKNGFDPSDSSYKDLFDSCAKANILRPNVFGEYNAPLDQIVIAPDRIVKYMIALKIDNEAIMASKNKKLIFGYLEELNFMHKFTHEIFHWDFGDTEFNKDLQKYFYELEFTFNKQKDGKFSYDTTPKKISEYKSEALKAFKEGHKAKVTLYNHLAKMIELGIHDFGELATEIGTTFIIPPSHGIVSVNGPKDIGKLLLNEAQSRNPTDFIRFVKSIQDEAYRNDCNIFDLVKQSI